MCRHDHHTRDETVGNSSRLRLPFDGSGSVVVARSPLLSKGSRGVHAIARSDRGFISRHDGSNTYSLC
jgi:hypothetical protein